MWFRADFRLHDNPALCDAVAAGPDGVVPLFVLDDRMFQTAGPVRRAALSRVLAALDEQVGGLHVLHGPPETEVPRVAREVEAASVHVTADFTPYGAERDAEVEAALDEVGVPLARTGSGYAVSPGRVTKADGTPYKVFTPFYRAWQDHGWRDPAPAPDSVPWLRPEGRTRPLPDDPAPDGMTLPPLGEPAAHERWREWLDQADEYDDVRNLPGVDATSRMSPHLKWGAIHPRTMLADLAALPRVDGAPSAGVAAYVRELGFREFYADVLHHRPDSATGYYDKKFERMAYDEPGDGFDAWREGTTGYPIVDAGMRQLRAEGWMHNRVRMIVASFLVKDLHVEWTHGAAYFMDSLVDGDIASNQHGWQWTAGCGTDASPFFRVFNPTTQGKKFDPDGTYVKRWVPELRDVAAKHVHEPWKAPAPPADYPPPIVDHAEERREALARYERIT